MITSDEREAAAAMERARTGNYGEDGYGVYVCPVCGAKNPGVFYIDDFGDCVGCSDCLWESDYPDWR